MEEDYLQLNNGQELVRLMVLACFEEFDPSRATPVDEHRKAVHNPLLQEFCQPLFANLVQKLPAALSTSPGK
jgi:hypothetical protein